MNIDDLGVMLYDNGNYWRVHWYDASGKRQSQSLGSKSKMTKRQALQKCYAVATEHIVRPASMSKQQAPTLRAWTDHFIASRPDLSDKTRDLYRYTIALLIGEFGADERIDGIDKFAARAWRTMLAKGKKEGGKGMAEATVCLHVRNAKTLFNMAIDDEIILRNPFAKLKGTPPETDKTWPELSDADIQRLIDAAPTPAWKAMVGLLAWAAPGRGLAAHVAGHPMGTQAPDCPQRRRQGDHQTTNPRGASDRGASEAATGREGDDHIGQTCGRASEQPPPHDAERHQTRGVYRMDEDLPCVPEVTGDHVARHVPGIRRGRLARSQPGGGTQALHQGARAVLRSG